jgi:hypothetical protein
LSVADNAVKPSVAGTWNIIHHMSDGAYSGNMPYVFDADGTFTLLTIANGTWTLVGNTLTLTSGPTVLSGTVTGQTASGTMFQDGSSTGTWTGVRQ